MLYNSSVVGFGLLYDGLYKKDLDFNHTNSINVVTSKRRSRIDESSLMLWHRRLGHISKDKMQRLIKEGVLCVLDSSNFDTCVDCIKGKPPVRARKGKRDKVLEIIYTNICGLISPIAMGGVDTHFCPVFLWLFFVC